MEEIRNKGLRWNANRIDQVSSGGGVFIVFNEEAKTFEVHETNDLVAGLRKEWWKRNFWYFSWFQPSEEKRAALKSELEKLDYIQAWNYI